MKPVTLLVIGAGSRGTRYARDGASLGDHVKVVGVAEPREFFRNRMVERYGVPRANVFTDWKQAAERPRFADAVIVATHDALHAEPAVAFCNLGYHMLLEKPMAPNAADCRRIVAAAEANNIIFAVCHVMRYTDYTRRVKSMIDSGAIGDVVCMQHLEPVGYWHQAHSFVRGNWRSEAASSPMLLSKSCHDLDWMRYIMGRRCLKVSSFGSLHHFTRANKPAGASDRCTTCGVEDKCPYSAKRFYLDRLERGDFGWPLDIIAEQMTREAVMRALESGPYGRCVYECDNDVVDHQVVALQFEGDRSATFTMTAFCEAGGRKTRIFGTAGELYGDGRMIEHFDFLTNTKTIIDTRASEASMSGGHGGGDYRLIESFIAAVANQDASGILSGPAETLETHLMVFAAEAARRECKVLEVGLAE